MFCFLVRFIHCGFAPVRTLFLCSQRPSPGPLGNGSFAKRVLSLLSPLSLEPSLENAFGARWRALAVDSTDFSSLWQLVLQTFHYDVVPGTPDQMSACLRMLGVLPPFSYNIWQSFYHEVSRQHRGLLPLLSSTQVARMVRAHHGPRASQLVESIPRPQRAAALQTVLPLPPSALSLADYSGFGSQSRFAPKLCASRRSTPSLCSAPLFAAVDCSVACSSCNCLAS